MALDRQRILNELGSVVNQLQSADCGCMGKLFNNPGQNGQIPLGNPSPTCGGCKRGCCHGHGYGGWNSGGPCGDPYTTTNYQQGMQRGDNYTMNNNMANKLVDSKNAFAAQSNSGGDSQYIDVQNTNMTNMSNNMESMQHKESYGNANRHMSGMGPQIMNMIGSKQVSELGTIRSNGDQSGNRLTEPMLIDAPQSPYGAVGVTPLSAPMRNNQGIYPNNNVVGYQNSNFNEYNHMMGTNISNTIPSSQNIQGSQNIPNMKTNPAAQQMGSSHHHHYGLHSQGVAKFNEMFPGVMKGMGGDSNFDPMAMAIQMNPANHHQTAMDNMQKMMSNNNFRNNKMFDSTGHTNTTLERPGIDTINNSNITHNQPNVPQVQNVTSEHLKNPNELSSNSNLYGAPSENNQQNYTAVTQQPISQHQMGQQNVHHQQYLQQQPTEDPRSGNAIPSQKLPTLYEGALGKHNDLSQVTNPEVVSDVPVNQQMIKEPILPADTSKVYVPEQKRYEYNTLGQPIEMLPAQVYHTREPALPQTLSPRPLQISPSKTARFSNVKSTISKTSLMGTKAINRTASRSQLQQIYNQYKGSQSYTQNNVRAPDNGTSYSDGKLNTPFTNIPAAQQNMPIERVGGDLLPNNQVQDQRTNKVEQVLRQIGDAPGAIKPTSDLTNPQVTSKKTRNGLQDQVYTSYTTSAAWSFHGDGARRYSAGYRNCYRV